MLHLHFINRIMLDLPILKYDHFSHGWAAPGLGCLPSWALAGLFHLHHPLVCEGDHYVSCELPLCCAMTFTEVSNRGFSQDQFLLWVWVKKNNWEGNVLLNWGRFYSIWRKPFPSRTRMYFPTLLFWSGHHFAKSHYGTEMGREMLANCCKI